MGGPVQIERRNWRSGVVAGVVVEVLDVRECGSFAIIAFWTPHNLSQSVVGPDELAKVAEVTWWHSTFITDAARRIVSENANSLDPKAPERQ